VLCGNLPPALYVINGVAAGERVDEMTGMIHRLMYVEAIIRPPFVAPDSGASLNISLDDGQEHGGISSQNKLHKKAPVWRSTPPKTHWAGTGRPCVAARNIHSFNSPLSLMRLLNSCLSCLETIPEMGRCAAIQVFFQVLILRLNVIISAV